MWKTVIVAGVAVAIGVIGGDMIDAKVGDTVAGADGKRTTLRRGVRIGIQTVLAVVLFGVAQAVT